ncbi:hypothetical protein ACHAWF_007168 [Thalassiosira exigua]
MTLQRRARPIFLLLFLARRASIASSLALRPDKKIRALSLDVTGTLLATREPVAKSYRDAALWARLPDPPTREELEEGFKVAFRERCVESPCFGGVEGVAGREWWRTTVARVLRYAKPGVSYDGEDFDRYFRRVYQHFGSPAGYRVLDDAKRMLATLEESDADVVLGITSNTPARHMESVLPMLDGLHDRFSWFTCSQDVKCEKPSVEMFEDAHLQAKFWVPDLEVDEVLHVGDSYACDYCGAKRYGFQSLLLDRSDNPSVTAYQDWLEAPDYEGKSLEDVKEHTITDLNDVASMIR